MNIGEEEYTKVVEDGILTIKGEAVGGHWSRFTERI